ASIAIIKGFGWCLCILSIYVGRFFACTGSCNVPYKIMFFGLYSVKKVPVKGPSESPVERSVPIHNMIYSRGKGGIQEIILSDKTVHTSCSVCAICKVSLFFVKKVSLRVTA